jgi:hypothetical protein
LHAQAHHIEPALLQIVDIASQLFVAHLGGLAHLFLEVGGRLAHLRERGHFERLIVVDSGTAELSAPALFVHPAIQLVRPVGPLGEQPLCDLESMRIKLKDRHTAELVPVGIEELIVVNIGMLAEDPLLIGPQVGLGRLSLDPVAQRVLPFVGMRQVKLIEGKQTARRHGRCQSHGHNDAIDAGARCFDGGDFVGPLHQAEGN